MSGQSRTMTATELDQASPPSSVSTPFIPAPSVTSRDVKRLPLRIAVTIWIAASLMGWALILAPLYFLFG